MKKKLLAILLLVVMCTMAVGCSSTGKKENYNIAYVSLYTYYTDASQSIAGDQDYLGVNKTPEYSSWLLSNANNIETVFLIDDWSYGDSDTIILYLKDGRILQTASSNVVLMYEPTVEGYEGSSDAVEINTDTNQTDAGNETAIAEDGSVESVDNNTYSLESLTSEQVVEEIKSCFNNKPVEGQSYEDYENSCKIKPTYDFYSYGTSYGDSNDCIRCINISGISTQMDGSIGFYSNSASMVYMTVTITLQDYDESVDVYNKLYDYLSPNYSSASNNTDGTSWRVSGKTSYNTYLDFVTLRKETDYYTLTATYVY